MNAAPPAPPLHVTVVANNPDTVDELHVYLAGAGIIVSSRGALPDVNELHTVVSALVMFPDDYAASAVVANIAALRAARPLLLIVLVTSAPQRLGSAVAPDGETTPPLLLPKPAFGWNILDVVRAHAAALAEVR